MGIIKKFRITTFKKEVHKIKLKKISLSFNRRQILDDISINIREGEICGLLGPNGVGKSSLFNIILGSLKPNYGNIFINGTDVTDLPIYKRAVDFGLSVVPQKGGVFAKLTCLENLKAISEIVIKNKNERSFKVEKMISKFELDAVKNTQARHCSGGQVKKTAIAMSLMSDPKIVLMDEPFQGLDILSTRDLQETIVNLQTEDIKRSCIISDHAAHSLLKISDRAIILANKKVVAEGTPSELLNDQNARKVYFGDSFKIN